MKKIAALAAVIAVAVIGYRIMTRPKLQYFSPSEFGVWWPLMNKELLLMLDEFRQRWGAPVVISSAQGGVGRAGGNDDTSQHNVDRWGEVRAVDIFPMVADGRGGYRYLKTGPELERAHKLALAVGFQGVGSYTDTVPGYMLHIDNRQDDNDRVEQWSRVGGVYLGESEAWV